MNPLMKVKISRDGVEIAQEELQNIESRLKYGALKITDHYWHEGMTEWKLLSELIAIIEKAREDAQIEKANKEREIARKEREIAREERRKIEVNNAREKAVREMNYYKCNCCRKSFPESNGVSDRLVKGCGTLFLSGIVSLFAWISIGIPIANFVFLLAATFVFLIALSLMLSAFARSPSCPNCGSSNFQKPENTDPNK